MSHVPSLSNAPATFFYADENNQPIGPLSLSDLHRLAAEGTVRGETLVFEEHGKNWIPFGTLPPLAPLPPLLADPAPARAAALNGGMPKFAKLALSAIAGVVFLLACIVAVALLVRRIPTGDSHTAAPPVTAHTAPTTPRREPLPNAPRFGVERGMVGFWDRSAVVEVCHLEASDANEDTLRPKLHALRLQQEKEGRRFDVPRDLAVRLVKEEPELDGMCEVVAEDAEGLKSARFWIHKSVLQGPKTFAGSRILNGGYTVFRGDAGTEVGGADVRDLLDLLVAVYDGTISDEAAKKCVFMPEAQSGEIQTRIGPFVIYEARYATWRNLVVFGVRAESGNERPLFSAPVRYVGREQFTTKAEVVLSIPVLVTEPQIQ